MRPSLSRAVLPLAAGAAERAGVEMIAGAQVVSSEGTSVTLADGRQFSADVLVGADGVKSVIRQRFGDDAPHFTGHVAWRCLVPVTEEIQDLSDFPGIIIGPGAKTLEGDPALGF